VVLDRAIADRQLLVGAIVVIAMARLVDGPAAWVVAVLLGAGVLAGAGRSRSALDGDPGRAPAPGGPAVPGHARAGPGSNEPAAILARARLRWTALVTGVAGIESGVIPAVLAASLGLAVRLVPIGWWLTVALALALVLVRQALALERSVARGTGDGDRWKVVLAALATAFLGFSGVASMVAGGLGGVASPGSAGSAGSAGIAGPSALGESDLLALAAADAVIAALIGFRLVRLGQVQRRAAGLSAAGFGAVVGLGAGLLRAMAIPQLLGPALLTVLVYLWDAVSAASPSIRSDPRWRWQVVLLVVLAAVVIGWNLALRR
jgi:hypothetical protein